MGVPHFACDFFACLYHFFCSENIFFYSKEDKYFIETFFHMLKIPPYSLEAEQSVLGSLLIDKDGFIYIADLLSHEDFYEDANAKIYEVMYELFRHNKPIDLITVREKLDDKKLLDTV